MGVKRRGDIYYCRLKINKREYLASCLMGSKQRAEALDDQIRLSIRRQDPDVLDSDGRDLARRLFKSGVNSIIPGFHKVELDIKREKAQGIALFEACEMLYKAPESKRRDVNNGKNSTTYRKRLKQCLAHVSEHLGADEPAHSIQVPDIEEYQQTRLDEGAAPATINKEVNFLSAVFRTLKKHHLCETNPCREVTPLPTKDAVRQVYISYGDFMKILHHLPDWYKPLALLGYYAAMRAGEIRTLSRDRIDLENRIIVLVEIGKIKERRRKLIPVHQSIIELLRQHLCSGQVIGLNHAFLRDGRAIEKDDFKRPWGAALRKAGLSTDINFHDLRHTWRRNARKSGLDPDIRRAIMGRVNRKKDVDEGYDLFDEEDFVTEIDKLRMDFGQTRIWVSQKKKTPQVASEG